MHRLTHKMAAEVRRHRSIQAQLGCLKGKFAGGTVVVVSCGPSLGTVDPARLRAGLKGVPAIVVKQAIDVVGDQTDFHCWNPFNVARFGRGAPETIRCLVTEHSGRVVQWNRSDLRFPQVPSEGDLGRSVAQLRNFDDFLLEKRAVRPFGPGIMYELVLYLAVHLGVSEILTVGWDIANRSGNNTHFYDRGDDRTYFETGRTTVAAPTRRRSAPESVRRAVRMGRTARLHRAGRVYNRTTPLPGESDLVGDSTAAAVDWLSSHGVVVRAVTSSTYLDQRIERLSPSDLLDRLDEVRHTF